MAIAYTDYMPFRSARISSTVTLPSGVEQAVLTLTTDALPAGTYTFTASFTRVLNNQTDELAWRFGGDQPSPIFAEAATREGQDDNNGWSYSFPFEWTGGVLTETFYATALDSPVDIEAANMFVKRVA